MHVAKVAKKYVTKDGASRESVAYLLRRTYRDGTKVRHETLANLSALPQATLEAVRVSLTGQTLVVPGQDLEVTRALPHGHVAAVHAQATALDLPALLGPAVRDRDIAWALIIAPGVPARFEAGHHPLVGPTPRWLPTSAWPTPPPTRCTRRWTGCRPARTPSRPRWSEPI